MPREIFVAGQILDAAELNVVSDQSVMVFATESARNTAIPFPTEGMVVYLQDSNNIRVYTGSSWEQMPISASNISSGTLPIGRGGTGATTLSSGGYLKGNGTSAITSQSGIPAEDITSGSLAVARGGTGFTDAILPRRTVGGSGTVDINGFATVTFPSGRFTTSPVVVVNRIGGAGGGSFEAPVIDSVSSTNVVIYINFAFTSFFYIAIQNS
jgi:hypothetical protein